ncbi:MAG TPA: NAD(+)/NADH kinase [Nitrospirae bacterium]|nr:NAD(+)/NADH kinase [Nitrospirota bacterium]
MKLVGIVANTQSPLAGEGVRKLDEWLGERGVGRLVESETASIANIESNGSRLDIAKKSDLIVVLGGDGTMISIAGLIEGRATPLLGINLGSLGFLTEFTYEQMLPAIERVLSGDFSYEDRIMLDTSIYYDGKREASYTSLNDLVIHRGALNHMIDIKVEVGSVFVNSYTADGLIVATPTGSTAYSLSSAGPIVYPSLNSFIITPISPHTLSNRPIVIPDNIVIEISVSSRDKGEALATLDGHVNFGIGSRHNLKIEKSKEVTRIIQSPFKDYYELLRSKLKWGETIRDTNR